MGLYRDLVPPLIRVRPRQEGGNNQSKKKGQRTSGQFQKFPISLEKSSRLPVLDANDQLHKYNPPDRDERCDPF